MLVGLLGLLYHVFHSIRGSQEREKFNYENLNMLLCVSCQDRGKQRTSVGEYLKEMESSAELAFREFRSSDSRSLIAKVTCIILMEENKRRYSIYNLIIFWFFFFFPSLCSTIFFIFFFQRTTKRKLSSTRNFLT